MLVLSRKVGERVIIGDGIVVVVKRVAGQRVTFGIEAPPQVRIVRGELELFPADPSRDVASPTMNSGSSTPDATARDANQKTIADAGPTNLTRLAPERAPVVLGGSLSLASLAVKPR